MSRMFCIPLSAMLLSMAACNSTAVGADAATRASATATPTSKGNSMDDRQKVQQAMGVTFPATATVQHAHLIEGRDNAASATLLLPAADWAKWRDTLIPPGSDVPPFSANANEMLGPDEGDWAPSKAKDLMTVQIPWRDGSEALNIGQATGPDGQVRIFLFWNQT